MRRSRVIRKNTFFLACSLGFLALLTFCGLAESFVSPFDPAAQELEDRFLPPGGMHLFGTDDLGRDILSRTIHGIRPALTVGAISVIISAIFGLCIGTLAGLGGPVADNALMLLMDAFLSFPTFLLAITVVAFLGKDILVLSTAIGVVFGPVFARLVRAEVLSLQAETFIEASKALGTGEARIFFLHILPNIIPQVIVQVTVTFSLALATEASLSYLGLGTQPPHPSWGYMLRDARTYISRAPWMGLFPGLALAFTIFCMNLAGDFLAGNAGRAAKRERIGKHPEN
jgi:ABC-type dipeptide/oligopeptide/nickel transport system permease subunit